MSLNEGKIFEMITNIVFIIAHVKINILFSLIFFHSFTYTICFDFSYASFTALESSAAHDVPLNPQIISLNLF